MDYKTFISSLFHRSVLSSAEKKLGSSKGSLLILFLCWAGGGGGGQTDKIIHLNITFLALCVTSYEDVLGASEFVAVSSLKILVNCGFSGRWVLSSSTGRRLTGRGVSVSRRVDPIPRRHLARRRHGGER